MTTITALDERVTVLEYAVFEQIPARLAAMNLAATQIYALTQANGEAIAGLRVDMAAMRADTHAGLAALKAALELQGDSLRKEIGVTGASVRADMTASREEVGQRFERAATPVRTLHAEMAAQFAGVDQRFADVNQRFAAVDRRFEAVDRRFDGIDAKLDTLITEIRGGKK